MYKIYSISTYIMHASCTTWQLCWNGFEPIWIELMTLHVFTIGRICNINQW